MQVLPLFGDKKPRQFMDASSNRLYGKFSPDGKWIAYSSNDTGIFEIYAQSFPTSEKRVQISKGGGQSPIWRKDGKELFYISGERKVMAVKWNGDDNVAVGEATALFPSGVESSRALERFYDVSADGQRFLLLRPTGEIVSTPFTVVLNWMMEGKR